MITKKQLDDLVNKGLDDISGLRGIMDAELFAAANCLDFTKVNLTTDVPCNGVEQPLGILADGVAVRLILKDGRYGFGCESGLHEMAPLIAAGKAIDSAHHNPLIVSLPKPAGVSQLRDYHDQRIFDASGEAAVSSGWRAIDSLVQTYSEGGFKPEDRIVVNGDITTIGEVMAIRSTTGIMAIDKTTIMMAYLTTMIQSKDAKGTGLAAGSSLDSFTPEEAGRMAAQSAIGNLNGEKIESGTYDVILGPQVVADLVNHFLRYGVTAELVAEGETPFKGKFGQKVVSELLRIYDDASIRGLAASKAYTCEGIPTGRVDLIEDGKLVGLLSSCTTAALWERLAQGEPEDKRVRIYRENLIENLGTDEIPRLQGRNGFRFRGGGGRHYLQTPSTSYTNLFVEGTQTVPEQSLVGLLGNGVFLGRTWYTYPIINVSKADVTSTAIADSYVVRNGEIAHPLQPNKVRVNDNFVNLFNSIEAIGDKLHPAIVWGLEGVVYAPYILIRGVRLEQIARFMQPGG